MDSKTKGAAPLPPPPPLPVLYTDLAEWFHLLTRPEDYAEEAAIYAAALRQAAGTRTVLELGSGGGNNAWHLKRDFAMALTDLSPAMLAISRRLNPELEHVAGDMRSLRLGRTFDAVFAHDAVAYMASEADVLATMETAYAHLRPGGVAMFMPDHTRETFRETTSHGGHDGEDVTPRQPGRSLRYLEWTHDPDPTDDTYVADFAYLLRDASGAVRCVTDRHTRGLFGRATWLRLLRDAGFQPETLPFRHSEVEHEGTIFLGRRRG
jgi:SAM-dependent methyltransferase